MEVLISIMQNYSTGKIVSSVLYILTMIVYITMLSYSIPSVSALAPELPIFDLWALLKIPIYLRQNIAADIRQGLVMQSGFFDIDDRNALLEKLGDPLPKLQRCVDWEQFRPLLQKVHETQKPI